VRVARVAEAPLPQQPWPQVPDDYGVAARRCISHGSVGWALTIVN